MTGANRGIGLALVHAYAERGAKVYATARNPEAAESLRDLATSRLLGEIVILQLDVTNASSVMMMARVIG